MFLREIDDSLIRFLFTLDLVALFLLLTGIVWSLVRRVAESGLRQDPAHGNMS